MIDGGEARQDIVNMEPTHDWHEMDFEKLLDKPLPRYRWAIDDFFYDLQAPTMNEPRKQKLLGSKYLMVGDTVEKTTRFQIPAADTGNPNYLRETSIVLRIEQSDCLIKDPRLMYGDVCYTQWSNRHPQKFHRLSYSLGESSIRIKKRHALFCRRIESRMSIGDRVCRGAGWDPEIYRDEDGGPGKYGTVVGSVYSLGTNAYIVKVRWLKSGHVNLYSWGYPIKFDGEPIYDVKKVSDEELPPEKRDDLKLAVHDYWTRKFDGYAR
jgi:hypothetical protein